jgi:lipoprotein NlpI
MMYQYLLAAIVACFATNAISRAADELSDLLTQAEKLSAAGKSTEAVGVLSKAIELSPKTAGAYYLRGRELFRTGKIKESVADFDKYVELRPELASRQWERGISLYYAGEFEKGAKQFELYQTFHDNDVENSVWRYLCMARSVGVEKARGAVLPIENDRRVPMMQIYDLYRGKLKPQDVLDAARAGEASDAERNARLFYAHLYLGLYHEAAGDAAKARTHIVEAADKHKIGHYMWDVARIHAELLRKQEKSP